MEEEEDVHNCPRCGYKTDLTSSFKKHLERKTICKAKLADVPLDELCEKYLTAKVITHTCDDCDKSFFSKSCFYAHKNTCNRETIQEMKKEIETLKLKYTTSNVLANKMALNYHVSKKVCEQSLVDLVPVPVPIPSMQMSIPIPSMQMSMPIPSMQMSMPISTPNVTSSTTTQKANADGLESLMYLCLSDVFNVIKAGYWKGTLKNLIKRYSTTLGKSTFLHLFTVIDPPLMEKEFKKAFAGQNFEHELYVKTHINNYITFLLQHTSHYSIVTMLLPNKRIRFTVFATAKVDTPQR
jgi:hypothetical protein